MHAPVVHDAAGDGLAAAPPVARLAVVTHVRLDPVNLADDAGFDLLGGRQDAAVPVPVVVGGDHGVALLGGGDHAVALGGGDGERLFADHVAAGLERLDSQLGVGVVRGDDGDQVDVGFLEHRGQRRVGLDAGEVLLGHVEAFRVNLRDGDRGHAGALHLVEMGFAHVEGAAVPDHAHLDILRLFELHRALLQSLPSVG